MQALLSLLKAHASRWHLAATMRLACRRWYAGIVGPTVEDADGHSCGFDDGGHRLVTFAEVKIGVKTGSIAPLPHDTGGLCNGLKQ
eukprot:4156418-Pleurochrysis_carterae.AAC.1